MNFRPLKWLEDQKMGIRLIELMYLATVKETMKEYLEHNANKKVVKNGLEMWFITEMFYASRGYRTIPLNAIFQWHHHGTPLDPHLRIKLAENETPISHAFELMKKIDPSTTFDSMASKIPGSLRLILQMGKTCSSPTAGRRGSLPHFQRMTSLNGSSFQVLKSVFKI